MNSGRHTILLLSWQVSRAMCQALWLITLARALGPENYGYLAGLAGLATALGALAGFGFGLLLLRSASQFPERLSEYWNKSLVSLGASTAILTPIYLLIAEPISGYSLGLSTMLAIALPELALLPLCIMASYAFQSRGMFGWAGAMYTVGPLGNLAAVGAFTATTVEGTLQQYLQWHLLFTAVAAIAAWVAVRARLPVALSIPTLRPTDTSQAAGLTAMRLADSGLSSIDKTLVLRLAGAEIAGHYTAAYRLAALVALPLATFAISVTPHMIRLAYRDLPSFNRFARRLLMLGFAGSLVSIPVALLAAYLLPYLFGAAFEEASGLAKLLSAFPGIFGMCALACAALLAKGKAVARASLQLTAVVGLAVAMIALVPSEGGRGAVYALLITYAVLTVALWWAALHSRHPDSD